MTIIPEIGELWEYRNGGQHLCVLVLGVSAAIKTDGVEIRCINIINSGFSRDSEYWCFSTEEHQRSNWKKVA